jgi:hypothetical protein
MKLTKNQLRKIIKEEISRILNEGTLYVDQTPYGGYDIEDDQGNEISLGQMVLDLKSTRAPIFKSEEAKAYVEKNGGEGGVQGGILRWDSGVLDRYVYIEEVIKNWAEMKNMTIQQGED